MEDIVHRADQTLAELDSSDPVMQRRAKAWRMRLDSYALQDIAESLGVSFGTAQADIQWCLKNYPPAYESADDFRRITILQLEGAKHRLWCRLMSRDTDNPDITERVLMSAQDMQAKLLGAYAPSRVDSSVVVRTELVGVETDKL